MDDEMFDEARQCPSCGVVTYCDNCPICGKKLTRTKPAILKLRRSKETAGEEENMNQPVGNKDFNDHMANRATNTERKESLFEKADHIDPKDILHHKKGRQRSSSSPQDKNKTISIVLAIIVIIAVLCIVFGQSLYSDASSTSNWGRVDEDFTGMIEQRTNIKGNQDEIEMSEYSYRSNQGESILSISNHGERSFQTDVYLYAGDEEIGRYISVYMLPHESFDLSIYSDGTADSYEFVNYEFYENDSTKPEFDYVTYNDYGSVDVEVEKSLSKEDLEILIIYLYQASIHSKYDVVSSLSINTPNKTSYDVYVDEELGTAEIYEIDRFGNYKDSYTILIGNTSENSIGVSL